ncbi:glycosyltransferase [Opitutus sp. GAS368]|uniref:glycosyltransferase n=1 Tax=Opitutus sp. GAS368 TaxID=1882749 RepID=UPI0015617F7E|nr:glycosyltransferase [Opitutus sp. GAS368]
MPPPPRYDSAHPLSETQPQRRILHVVFSSRIAGSERYCLDLANRQAALGHEVHVAGMSRSPLAAALAPGVTFHGFGLFFRGLRLRRLVMRLQPEVCHGHLSAACKALGRLPARFHTVATLHVGYKPRQHSRLGGLICVNGAQGGRLTGYRGLARTIPNWLPERGTALSAPGFREKLGLSAGTFLVGAVGRLHPSKGMDVLISAFRAAAPAHAALVILGEGPQRAELETLRAGDPRIHLPGYCAEVHDCLREIDLFVSPSREESFGLAIVEAMGAGVPIVATAAEGPAEFLRNQPVALVEPGSITALSAELSAAAERFQAGALPRQTYDLSVFDPTVRVANVMDFYRTVIEAQPQAASRTWTTAPAGA